MPLPQRPPSTRTLMRHEAYRELRRLIVDGTLRPAERLRDQDVARWLGVSRTPVREALTRLADEGLIEMAPNRFTRVRPITPADARQGYPIAAELHSLATELATPVTTDEQLDRLAEEAERYAWALLRGDGEELVGADVAFHDMLLELAANAQLAAHVGRLEPRLRQIELSVAAQIAPTRPDPHEAVIAALAARDGATAGRLVGDEWRVTGELVAGALALTPAGAATG